ncbi:MAG: 2-oxo-hepta-3-ene-1,7-dioic acid hydratase [Gammaproteobacteria bacterium]|nr:2-oxo-hepta-3-ene-1,7-dioic acid hydratase [Gammaproteobacteria bacterium]
MLTTEQIQAAAQRLDEAERTRRQIRQISLDHPEMTMGDAYAIQHAWVEQKIAAGRVVRGRKIGLTSRAMQQSSQIDEPDYGTLLDDMFFEDGARIPAGDFLDPMIEVELAFILKDRLEGEDVTIFDVLSATEYVTPALELIAARCERKDSATGRPRKVLDTISDNAANAGIILGGRPIRPLDVDIRWVSAIMYRNGAIEETGVAAGVLNHPANGIVWLTRKFAPHGISLEPGQVILAGSFTRPVAARPGDTFQVDYGPLGSIACHFT